MNYPYVCYPAALHRILSEDFELPDIASQPLKPDHTLPKVTGVPYIWFSIAIFIIGAISDSAIVSIISSFLVLFSSIFLSIEKANLKSAQKSFKKIDDQYLEAIAVYYSKMKIRKEFIENLKNPKWKSDYKNKLVKDIFLKATRPEIVCLTNKGITEDFFHDYLVKYFNDLQIKTNLTIKQYNKNLMIPDFIIFDQKNNLYIDIEIDEPYTYQTREPIHYYEEESKSHIDGYRNYFFTTNNWVVIRFAEEQITDYPNQCCYFISTILQSLTNGKRSILSTFENKTLKEIKCWTKEMSLAMEKSKYREDYLSATNDLNILKKVSQNNNIAQIGNVNKRRQSYNYLMASCYAKNINDEV